ncbi:WcbI family polysaccharide biosynthesis putative acetyltransferase [Corynebacterium sanguinis]|uniref:Polysaccharide biosynthesis enzyme WcbI domain-containing protein n=1 Tax=Corynebacterium sanguinis TaxID=2594913 RepID=A0A6C1TXD9_9CORY|nr:MULTISPECIES: WcbI family polysaccharide biosynthesis putative acetyltransferase [Corynebacterium]MBA4506081.1 hypothetical protein [Corynebacterium sanguinis]MCT1414547.1 WcbI family polysaccharide biosynthesis putative acetyltransferase [Corynebacterium sanguinis]MCT1426322.1 WcbI family polysaccharide biosynthesis putative acetyltransferase [Corynebacterium sanguinis]MCT1491669.1 WcbI family polysaccharide biosynthesis putative acetyltransferase [Corynebacterium sanguinis]MCT1499154.1 Wc
MPTLTVVGNCQAESTRKLLMSCGKFDSERIAPVHELEANDMGWFGDLIARTDVLVTQPIRDNYRGLPVGTSELVRQLPARARHVVVPVLRFDALMPYQAIIRDPDHPSLNPPVVPYHDLRILAAAARGLDSPVDASPPPPALRRAAAMSIAEIRSREQRHGSVVISDYLETTPVWHTVNHPSNATLVSLAERILAALGISGGINAPDYEMLGELDAPVAPEAATALGVSVTGRAQWTRRGGEVIDDSEIAAQQLEFYRARPALVAHGMTRHAQRISNLGLA